MFKKSYKVTRIGKLLTLVHREISLVTFLERDFAKCPGIPLESILLFSKVVLPHRTSSSSFPAPSATGQQKLFVGCSGPSSCARHVGSENGREAVVQCCKWVWYGSNCRGDKLGVKRVRLPLNVWDLTGLHREGFNFKILLEGLEIVPSETHSWAY